MTRGGFQKGAVDLTALDLSPWQLSMVFWLYSWPQDGGWRQWPQTRMNLPCLWTITISSHIASFKELFGPHQCTNPCAEYGRELTIGVLSHLHPAHISFMVYRALAALQGSQAQREIWDHQEFQDSKVRCWSPSPAALLPRACCSKGLLSTRAPTLWCQHGRSKR